jgi:tetratricopeptide repeat protein 19
MMYRFARVVFSNYRRLNTLKNHVDFEPKKLEMPKMLVSASILSYFGLSKKNEDDMDKDEQELIMTIKRGVLCTMREDFERAEQLYHLALRNAQAVNNELAVTYIYDLMANLAYEIGNLHRIINGFSKLRFLSKILGQLPKAEKLFVSVMQRLMDREKAAEDDIRLLHISSKIAHIAYLENNMDKALLGYQFVLEKIEKRDYMRESNYHELYGIVKNLIGQAYIALKRFPEAKAAFLEAQKIFQQYKDDKSEDAMILLNNLSCACAELKEYDSALRYLKETIELAKKIDIEDTSPYHINLGMLYLKQKLLDNAKSSCKNGWQLANKYKNTEAIQASERCLEQIKKAIT